MNEHVLNADGAAPSEPTGIVWGGAPPLWVAIAAGSLVVAADWLFYGHSIGWTLGAFGAAFAVLLAAGNIELLRRPAARFAWMLALLACLGAVVEPTVLAVVLFLIALLSFQASGRSAGGGTIGWLLALAQAGGYGIVQLMLDGFRLPGWMVARAGGGSLQALFRAWALPVAAGSLFLVLFAAANPLLDAFLLRFDFERALVEQLPGVERVAFWCFVGGLVWWLVRARLPRSEGADEVLRAAQQSAAGLWGEQSLVGYFFAAPAILRSMLLFNVMFAMQNGMDMAYLWGHAALPPGFTFASYAHRGAYPLMATVLLAAAFVLVAFRAGAPSEHARGARALMYLWVVQNVVLVASSIWRMVLYVEVYSLTYLRVTALVWMGLVALGLSLIVVRFAAGRSNTWLVNANAIALGATLYVAVFADIGGVVADYNVRHARELGGKGVHLDLAYVGQIGVRALPALERYCRALQERAVVREEGAPLLLTAYERQAHGVEAGLRLEVGRREASWRGWSYLTHRVSKPEATCRSST